MKKYYSLLVILVLICTIIVIALARKAVETDNYFDNLPKEVAST